jgi:hypothetical protein
MDQKYAGDQQYKKKGTKSLEQNISKTSLLNRNQREQAPLNKQSKGTGSLEQASKPYGNKHT